MLLPVLITPVTTGRTGMPESRLYRWRDPAWVADAAEMERLRAALDAEAGETAEPMRATAAPVAVTETAAPAPPPARCPVCRYLAGSIGHRVNCP